MWGKPAAKSIMVMFRIFPVCTVDFEKQQEHSSRLVSAVAMAKLQFLAALACAAVDEACNKNSDCASNWCDGGTFFSSGRCKPRRADGERAVRELAELRLQHLWSVRYMWRSGSRW